MNNIQSDFENWWLDNLVWNLPTMIVTGPHWWEIKIGSVNGFVPSGTNIDPDLCRHFDYVMWCLNFNKELSFLIWYCCWLYWYKQHVIYVLHFILHVVIDGNDTNILIQL